MSGDDSDIEVIDVGDETLEDLADEVDGLVNGDLSSEESEGEPPLRRPRQRRDGYASSAGRDQPSSSPEYADISTDEPQYGFSYPRVSHPFDDVPVIEEINPLHYLGYCQQEVAQFIRRTPGLLTNLNEMFRDVYDFAANRPCADPFCRYGRARRSTAPETDVRRANLRDLPPDFEERCGDRRPEYHSTAMQTSEDIVTSSTGTQTGPSGLVDASTQASTSRARSRSRSPSLHRVRHPTRRDKRHRPNPSTQQGTAPAEAADTSRDRVTEAHPPRRGTNCAACGRGTGDRSRCKVCRHQQRRERQAKR